MNDNNTLKKILCKVESVQVGLLRIKKKDKKFLLQARAGSSQDQLNCIITTENNAHSLVSQHVSLIQKDKQDYLYISCVVKDEVFNKKAVVMSMEVVKACWFTRRFKGSLSWLQPKYSYEAIVSDCETIGADLNLAS